MLKSNFHTIKSILNISSPFTLAGILTYFHTIKSILNLVFEPATATKQHLFPYY